MKRLHVDRPEDIDDHKETDLLQRLVISWDTPPEQLAEVVGEVDAWLAHRSEESVSLLDRPRSSVLITWAVRSVAQGTRGVRAHTTIEGR